MGLRWAEAPPPGPTVRQPVTLCSGEQGREVILVPFLVFPAQPPFSADHWLIIRELSHQQEKRRRGPPGTGWLEEVLCRVVGGRQHRSLYVDGRVTERRDLAAMLGTTDGGQSWPRASPVPRTSDGASRASCDSSPPCCCVCSCPDP